MVGKGPFDPQRVKSYWFVEAEEALQVAEHLLEKNDYSYALFFGHLAIEKLLKALFSDRRQAHAPQVHNLVRLAMLAGMELDDSRREALLLITAFRIEARYPDIKREFRKRCTAEYSEEQMATIRETYAWLRSQLTSSRSSGDF